jgi:CheY-like chemotaxis protein
VVDDEPDILLALRVLFEDGLGGRVVVTTMPHVALMALGTKPGFDLVITDFRMPGMNGLEFLQRAKELHPETPRVLMTAFMDAKLRKDAVTLADVSLCLSKPFEPVELLKAAGDILGRTPAKGAAGPGGKAKERSPGRIPLFGASRGASKAAQEVELLTARCSVCGAQTIVDEGDWTQDRSGWMARPCFMTPACRGMIQPDS